MIFSNSYVIYWHSLYLHRVWVCGCDNILGEEYSVVWLPSVKTFISDAQNLNRFTQLNRMKLNSWLMKIYASFHKNINTQKIWEEIQLNQNMQLQRRRRKSKCGSYHRISTTYMKHKIKVSFLINRNTTGLIQFALKITIHSDTVNVHTIRFVWPSVPYKQSNITVHTPTPQESV